MIRAIGPNVGPEHRLLLVRLLLFIAEHVIGEPGCVFRPDAPPLRVRVVFLSQRPGNIACELVHDVLLLRFPELFLVRPTRDLLRRGRPLLPCALVFLDDGPQVIGIGRRACLGHRDTSLIAAPRPPPQNPGGKCPQPSVTAD